ncbi:MAG: hypothetical protein M1823_001440 [Watsoniomyces obsoletus]|nr:MAG: hypothetical protein M1823_001440 [Watsoniomyces obsoletus]
MPKALMRIPYTGPLPPPRIIPHDATTLPRAIEALARFLVRPPRSSSSTVILSGAGLSVASGLADYRGVHGTYRLNQSYRPIYYTEFLQNHEARKRYWARSFMGWTTLHNARPNAGHHAVRKLGEMGLVRSVVTQNVDSFHSMAHPELHTIELHGFLRSLVCLSCGGHLTRAAFQESLAKLNPRWAAFLAEVLASGALKTEDPAQRSARGLKTNPDGDVDLPDAPYSTFRYPACPTCLETPPVIANGQRGRVEVDADGAWLTSSTAGILKPAVVMFGESIPEEVKVAAERAIDEANRILVIGSSLATYSAWRLVRRAQDRDMPIGILNLGGVRGEQEFYKSLKENQSGEDGVRLEMATDVLLPALVEYLK